MAVHSGRGGWMLCLLKVVRFSYKLCKISVLQIFAKKKKKKSVFVKTPETILRDRGKIHRKLESMSVFNFTILIFSLLF